MSSGYYDCSPENSNTNVQVKNDRKLLRDIKGIFNFLASIGTSLLAIFGFKRLIIVLSGKPIEPHILFIYLLLLICVALVVFFYGIFGGGTGYSMFGLTNLIIPFIYIVLLFIGNSNFRKNINFSIIIKTIEPTNVMKLVVTFCICIAIAFSLLFGLFYNLKNKKHKKVKKNKGFLPTMIILSVIGSLLMGILVVHGFLDFKSMKPLDM